jgi:hypothetical protein
MKPALCIKDLHVAGFVWQKSTFPQREVQAETDGDFGRMSATYYRMRRMRSRDGQDCGSRQAIEKETDYFFAGSVTGFSSVEDALRY